MLKFSSFLIIFLIISCNTEKGALIETLDEIKNQVELVLLEEDYNEIKNINFKNQTLTAEKYGYEYLLEGDIVFTKEQLERNHSNKIKGTGRTGER